MDEIKDEEAQCLLLPDEDDVFTSDKADLSRLFHIGP